METVGCASNIDVVNRHITGRFSIHHLKCINDLDILNRAVEAVTGDCRVAALDDGKEFTVIAYSTLNGDILVVDVDRSILTSRNYNRVTILSSSNCRSDSRVRRVANFSNGLERENNLTINDARFKLVVVDNFNRTSKLGEVCREVYDFISRHTSGINLDVSLVNDGANANICTLLND